MMDLSRQSIFCVIFNFLTIRRFKNFYLFDHKFMNIDILLLVFNLTIYLNMRIDLMII